MQKKLKHYFVERLSPAMIVVFLLVLAIGGSLVMALFTYTHDNQVLSSDTPPPPPETSTTAESALVPIPSGSEVVIFPNGATVILQGVNATNSSTVTTDTSSRLQQQTAPAQGGADLQGAIPTQQTSTDATIDPDVQLP